MLIRENIIDKQRVISSILKSANYPKEYHSRLNVLLKDISSLINHTDFGFERLEYLQNTVLGIINLDQNKIMKVFTLVSLLLMPPTLIASFFGMNVQFGWFGTCRWSWLIALGLMGLSTIVVFWVFKKRRMF
jgi:magnesium transporter